MERVLDRVQCRLGAGRHVQLERLTAVPKVERAQQALLVGAEALLLKPAPRGVLHLGEEASEQRPTLPQMADPCPHVVVLDVGGEQPEGREVAGMPRHQHAQEPDLVGQRQRVHRAGAAVGDQGEVPRIVAALDGDFADGGGHADHRDPDDPLGERLNRHVAEAGGERAYRLARAGQVDRDGAAEPAVRTDPPKHDVGVRHGGLGTAQAVCGRAPTECMSICATFTGNAPIMPSDVITGARSRTRHTSVEVPPMS